MSLQKRNVVILTYIAIFSLIVPAIFWFSSSPQKQKVERKPNISPKKEANITNETQVQKPQKEANNANKAQVQKPQLEIARRISTGGKILITADSNPQKEAAAESFRNGDYAAAVIGYKAAIEIKRNDPEAWIYKNNAEALVTGDFLKIAVGVPIGGNLNVAKEMLRGIAQVQEEVNSSGGINGKLLQVTIANDDNDPTISKQVALNLSQDKNILGIVGHNSTEASMAAAPIYQEAGLVMISPTTVGSGLSDIGDYIFRTTPDTRATAYILANYAVKSARKTNIAICFASGGEASQSFKNAFEWSLFQAGGKLIDIDCDFSQPDFNPANISTKAIASGADALLINPSIYNIDRAIDVVQANKQRLPLLGNQTMYIFETLQQGSADANGMVLSVAWHPVTNSNNAFTKKARKFWGGSVGWRTAMSHDATEALVKGLKSGSTRQQLQKTLTNADFAFSGATGNVKFLPSGERNLKGNLVEVAGGKKSGVGYDFVPLTP